MAFRRKRYLVSVQTLLISAGAGILILIGGLVIAIGYHGLTDALRVATQEQFQNLGALMQERTRRLIDPVRSQLGILIHDPLSSGGDLSSRLDRLPVLAASLRGNKVIRNVYAGYPNGEFFMVRHMDRDSLLDRFSAPRGTRFMVQSQTLDTDGAMVGEYRFFDSDLRLLERQNQPHYKYDPRGRPWYEASEERTDSVTSPPYAFFTTGNIGITVSQRTADAGAIIGMDATIAQLAEEVGEMRITPATEAAIVEQDGTLIAYPDLTRIISVDSSGRVSRNDLEALEIPVLDTIREKHGFSGGLASGVVEADGRDWVYFSESLDIGATAPVRLLLAAPSDELFSATREILRNQGIVILLVILLSFPIGLFIVRQIVRPLGQLAIDVQELAAFDFDNPIEVKTRVREASDLAETVEGLRLTVSRFLDINRTIAAEEDFDTLLVKLLDEIIATTKTEAGILYLTDEDETRLVPYASRLDDSRPLNFPIPDVLLSRKKSLVVRAAEDENALGAEATQTELERMGLAGIVDLLDERPQHLLGAPLFNRSKDLIGVILLLETDVMDPALVGFTEALSGSAAVSVEARQLIAAQRELFESFIQLIAGAIDAKSPYTGGHCARVPELTKMLGRAAEAATEGPFKDFALSRDDWQAIHVASWLHDCGKVTTPEFVVDKATKLETIYDRIHEVRMRVEVMKREAEIRRLRKALDDGGISLDDTELAEELAALDADFAFLADMNQGGEFLDDEKLKRLKTLAARTWTRTLDDRLGVSHEERARKERTPARPLPVEEPLLADKPEHMFARPDSERIEPNNAWGFRMDVPELLYNRGEVHNLSVRRGTLTDEDRYKINEHIVQTIKMLEMLPFPKHLRSVPELAGGHHEKMDGTGYPKRLTKDEMSPVARMMAIADIFEALTAVDRPYKKGKTLSEALRIMGFMVKDQHIDPELFELFIETGVYREYAERFLRPEQIDEVDPESLLPNRAAE